MKIVLRLLLAMTPGCLHPAFAILPISEVKIENTESAAKLIELRSLEGTYALRSHSDQEYLLTIIRGRTDRVLASLADRKVYFRKSYLHIVLDDLTHLFKMAPFEELGHDGMVPSALLSIDGRKRARLEFLDRTSSLGVLEGKLIDPYPALNDRHKRLEAKMNFRGQIELPTGKPLSGLLTLTPVGSQILGIFESDDGLIRREFRQGDQEDGLRLTSIQGRNQSFLHLRLNLSNEGILVGYAVVAGLGRSQKSTRFLLQSEGSALNQRGPSRK